MQSQKLPLDGGTSTIRAHALLIPILCVLSMVIEGIDSNVISYVGPIIKDEFGFSGPVLGLIYSATVISSLLGAAGVAPLSDHLGRRPVMLAATMVLAMATLLTPSLTNAWELFAVRLVVGVAFGAAVPTTFALAADYAPPGRRAFVIMIVTAGVALGYVVAGYASALVIPHWGWRALMYLAGSVSLSWAVTLFVVLPRSLTTGSADRAELQRTAVGIAWYQRPAKLFTRELRTRTILIWFIVSCAYAAELLVAFWFPAMLLKSGYSIAQAASITATGKIASIVGSALIGLIMDRYGIGRTLMFAFFLTALAFLALSASFSWPFLFVALIVVGYFLLDGSFAGSQALAVASYPAELRATASGWITGFARLIGGGAGTLAGGALIGGASAAGVTIIIASTMFVAGAAQWFYARLDTPRPDRMR